MKEHRRIERVVKLLSTEVRTIQQHNEVEPDFICFVVDFFRTYADRTHHGKEEDILFERLEHQDMNNGDADMMRELMKEHTLARETVSMLSDSNTLYLQGNHNALDMIKSELEKIITLYPSHIEKEDKMFFAPAMNYFSEKQQQQMLSDFNDFDKMMIHEKYENLVKERESNILTA